MLKSFPTPTYRDAPTSVTVIALLLWIAAALKHSFPTMIRGRLGFPVGDGYTSARHSFTTAKLVGSGDALLSAVTLTEPSSMSLGVVVSVSQDQETNETFTDQIYFAHAKLYLGALLVAGLAWAAARGYLKP
jgi:hypothetical protein